MELDITVLKVTAANRLYNTPTENPIRRRYRTRWGVALKRTGKTIYTVNGRQILSDNLHPVIMPRGCSYSWRCVEPGECIIIEFDAVEELNDVLSFTVSDSSFIEKAFWEIQKNIHIITPEASLTCRHLLYGLLLQLVKSAPKEYVSKGRQQLLQPALDYISEHYFDPNITNQQLASMCGISTVYFRKSFEAICGVSPIRHLHNIRIQRAKDILSSDYDSISLVAESVGYGSVFHFSKMFKLYTGMSPTEYAKTSRV